MADFVIRQGATSPVFNYTITADGTPSGTPVNVQNDTINFVMRPNTANFPTTNASISTSGAGCTSGSVSYTFTTQDTANPGIYQAYFNDTTKGQPYPTVGLLEIEVQQNITTPGGNTLVGLGEVKDYLNIPASNKTHDGELTRFVDGLTPVVEFITGPILQRQFVEFYDGGNTIISLRHRPIISIQDVVEWRGPIAYDLTQVATPDLGTIYSYMYQPPGRVVRRTVGGGMTPFPPGFDQVRVTYTAGYQTIPSNVRMGALEIVRVNWQQTQQAGRPLFGGGAATVEDDPSGKTLQGYFVPDRVWELLAPSARHPSTA